jgi:KDO2-lipid IV(A) lauroyltransferase
MPCLQAAEVDPKVAVSMANEVHSEKRPLVMTKDILWLIYLYPLRFLAWLMPAATMRLLGRALGRAFQLVSGGQKRVVVSRLAGALGPEVSVAELERMADCYAANSVNRAIDDLILNRLIRAGRLNPADLRGLEHLQEALAPGRGVVLLSGHFFANRVAKRWLAGMGYSPLSVRNGEPPDRRLGRLGKRWLQPRFSRFLHAVIRDEAFVKDPQCPLKILKRLRCGGIVSVNFDGPFAHHRAKLPFLGRIKRFPTGFLEIIRLSRCAVVPMLCLGDSRHFTIRFLKGLELGQWDSREEFVSSNLPTLVRILESDIRAHPEEWELWALLRDQVRCSPRNDGLTEDAAAGSPGPQGNHV